MFYGSCLAVARGKTTHGMRFTSEYRIWGGMKQRCLNPKNPSYIYYGGRGIKVCASWLQSFEAFYADMGSRPSTKHTLDRRENNSHYEPGNCYWATPIEQMNNTRRNRIVNIGGENVTLAEAHRRGILAVPAQKVSARVYHGWSIEDAISTPSIDTRGEDHSQAKLTAQQVSEIRKLSGLGLTQ